MVWLKTHSENDVFDVFNVFLRHFSDDGGHILRKLGSKLHFWVFIQIVLNQEPTDFYLASYLEIIFIYKCFLWVKVFWFLSWNMFYYVKHTSYKCLRRAL